MKYLYLYLISVSELVSIYCYFMTPTTTSRSTAAAIATTTAIGTSLMMGLIDYNGSNLISDPAGKEARSFPSKVSTVFEESEELQGLKDKYPAYKNN